MRSVEASALRQRPARESSGFLRIPPSPGEDPGTIGMEGDDKAGVIAKLLKPHLPTHLFSASSLPAFYPPLQSVFARPFDDDSS